ncbi:hypothetical protein Zmor_007319 [Zophobas morio]|uniref:Uncharacterized protein n=1 Tax=Zophobas morio TaxID=2755281 RepID=A0AA38HQ09_9CUCU|nr:hypothetical protein Zmor_027870 [Zophobas morio]KAJ3663007.1 hypothetical protein Zmor_007319 [Zophobas morio]
MPTCVVFSKNVKDNELITCDICKNPAHAICDGLSRQEMDCLRSKNRKIRYFCTDCNIVVVIGDLKNEVEELKEKISSMHSMIQGSTASSTNGKTLSEDDIIKEVEDRLRRTNNIVVSNLPESEGPDNIDEHISKFLNLLPIKDEIKNEIIPEKCYRIGKVKSDDKHHLFLVKCRSPSAVVDVL